MEIKIIHDPVGQKFEAIANGKTNVLAYTEVNNIWDIFEVAVSEELRGLGIAERLALAAFEYAKKQGIKIIPSCPYIKNKFLKDHPEFLDIVTESFY